MKYNVNVSPITNMIDDKNFFFGTGFFGKEISSYEDFKKIIHENVMYKKDGKSFFYDEIEVSFCLADTIDKVKSVGNEQCKTEGLVNLFEIAKIYKSDPFSKFTIFFSPNGWIKDGKVFKLIIMENNTKVTPFYGKWSELLYNIGIRF